MKEFRSYCKNSISNLLANEVILRRLFDQNYVLLDETRATSMNQKTVDGETKLFEQYRFMERQEETDLKRRMATMPRDFQIIISYMRAPIPGEYGDEVVMECLPMTIQKGDNFPI